MGAAMTAEITAGASAMADVLFPIIVGTVLLALAVDLVVAWLWLVRRWR
jgi:hypothetical protein